ncbi:MAG: DUF1957 domain-containing protein [Myxococcaceae bacterium]
MSTRLLLVLHAHLPWIPRAHPEREWLLQAISDCYLPLLEVIERTPEVKLTVSVSPTLSAMLSERTLGRDFDGWLEKQLALLPKVASRSPAAAAFWRKRWSAQRAHGAGVLARLHHAQRRGRVELIACNATHAFMPLLAQCKEAVEAQVAIAVESHRRRFGKAPRGLWPAECGYFPGAEEIFARHGLRYFFVDTHGLLRASPPATFREPAYCENGVAVLARDPEASEQVWSRRAGYPGDADYLDYHHRLEGLRLFRVTGREEKDVWHPEAAFNKAREHAAHFVRSRAKEGAQWAVAPYDAELFGHWWLEGPAFLAEVCRLAAQTPGLELSTASEAVKAIDDAEVVAPAQSSWGRGGQAAVWLDESNAAFWPKLIRASEQMLRLARSHCGAKGVEEQALDQALRELLLAQSSDWPFLLEAKTNAGYAQSRFEDHLAAFNRLASELDAGAIDLKHLAQRRRTHNLFGWLDFRIYGP